MKYMRLGTKPDTFFVEAEFPLLIKCGLIQRLCFGADDSSSPVTISLHDIQGGEEAFELCAKFCYGIAITLSARNFAQAISGAKFLRMTESVAKANFLTKLESFFDSCILRGWKDSIVTLQSMWELSGWSDDHRVVQLCMDSIIEKIIVLPSKVTWSFTYTRPGYKRRQRHSVPKDWWTEDIAELDLERFSSIITTVRSTRKLTSALIGEALHVYVSKHLPDPVDPQHAQTNDTSGERRIIESIVSMIPNERGSVTGKFLLRLLKIASYVGVSSSTRAELIKRGGRKLDEVSAGDLLIPSASDPQSYDIGAVEMMMDNFFTQFRQASSREDTERMRSSMRRVGKSFDGYLQLISKNADVPVLKFIELAESLPQMAREEHDELYRAIDTYLKEHKDVSKANKKRLCQIIDCRKLSPEVRANAIANEQLPLRTIVQLLFVEQERDGGSQCNFVDRAPVYVSEARSTRDERRSGKTKREALIAEVSKEMGSKSRQIAQ